MDITGRKLFVKALQEEGVTTLFGYPGGTVTDLFDELYKQDGIEVVLPRHEQGLIHEAEGYARSTGKVGVCLVTSGPGATNIMTGLADAHYDSIPLVCFTGQVPLSLIGNVSGGRYCGHDAEHHQVRRDGAEKRGSGAHHQDGVLHCLHGEARTGAHRYPEGHPDGARTCRVSFQCADPRLQTE